MLDNESTAALITLRSSKILLLSLWDWLGDGDSRDITVSELIDVVDNFLFDKVSILPASFLRNLHLGHSHWPSGISDSSNGGSLEMIV